MELPILSAAALGLAVLSYSDGGNEGLLRSTSTQAEAEGPAALLGRTLWASEDPIDRWGDPVRAEDLSLESLGHVAQVVTTPEGEPRGIVVSLGGLWGYGSQEVELGMERVHLVGAADGEPRLVLDLSAAGAEPSTDGSQL